MKTKWVVGVCSIVMAGTLQAQNPPPEPAPPRPPKGAHVFVRHEMGQWWKNPDIASKLQLTDAQVAQLNQVFFDHKMHLIDFGADMEKQDLKLQTLLDADQPNEGEVGSQVDQVLAARGKLEREFTMMNLNLRKVLSLDQWRQLKAIRGDVNGPGTRIMRFKDRGFGPAGPGEGGDVIYFKQFHTEGGGEGLPPLPPPPGVE